MIETTEQTQQLDKQLQANSAHSENSENKQQTTAATQCLITNLGKGNKEKEGGWFLIDERETGIEERKIIIIIIINK